MTTMPSAAGPSGRSASPALSRLEARGLQKAYGSRKVVKDVSLAVEVGREFDVPMRLANLTYAELTEALNRGWGQRDSRVAMLLQEERAGIEVQVPPDEDGPLLVTALWTHRAAYDGWLGMLMYKR